MAAAGGEQDGGGDEAAEKARAIQEYCNFEHLEWSVPPQSAPKFIHLRARAAHAEQRLRWRLVGGTAARCLEIVTRTLLRVRSIVPEPRR